MKERLKNLKYRLVATWWLLTRKNFYLFAYQSRTSESLESYNVVLPEFVEWLKDRHGMLTNREILRELKSIGTLVQEDALAYNEVTRLIEKLKDGQTLYEYGCATRPGCG